MQFNEIKEMHIFGLGNPLLDITATVDDDLLQKYDLPKDSAILADAKHLTLFDDVVNNYEIDYTAGGSTQNTLRYCQWVVGINNPVSSYFGCIGNDYFGKIMEKRAKADGVNVKYMVDAENNTGLCTVLLTEGGKCRSLCANLGASQFFSKNFLLSHFVYAERAKIIYTTGHMLPVSFESVMLLAKHAHQWGKDLFFNLAAPYVSEKCAQELIEVMLYVDFFFANELEARSFSKLMGYQTTDLKEIAKLLSREPKIKYTNQNIPKAYKDIRIVVVTQSENPVLLARTDSDEVREFPVIRLPEEKIKDTNGAGDAFTGGFLAMYIENKSIEECLKCAIYCASECIQLMGCSLPKKMAYELENQ